MIHSRMDGRPRLTQEGEREKGISDEGHMEMIMKEELRGKRG